MFLPLLKASSICHCSWLPDANDGRIRQLYRWWRSIITNASREIPCKNCSGQMLFIDGGGVNWDERTNKESLHRVDFFVKIIWTIYCFTFINIDFSFRDYSSCVRDAPERRGNEESGAVFTYSCCLRIVYVIELALLLTA